MRRWGPLFVTVLCGVVAVVVSVVQTGLAAGADSVAGGRSYRLKVDAVAYHLPGRTALGVPVGRGVVAVDPRLIPLGTRMHVPGYGPSIAADVGTAIKGRIIDLWMPTDGAARRWGRRTVRITVYP
jgi:3D (Asp-Asp-Asp) domain-containing protein